MTSDNLNTLRQRFLDARTELTAAQKKREPETVVDYTFAVSGKSVTLSELFGNKNDLFVIHNMGTSCAYCTLWADGFNGVFDHWQDRASVVISSPDTVATQQQFKTDRNWRFTMVSTADNTFASDMGYRNEQGYHPGVSVFSKTVDGIKRVADTPFGPGDDFCAVWHLFDLLPEGNNGWQPKFSY